MTKMPRQHRSAGWSKKTSEPRRLWNADGVGPETPTSIDVLFQWLNIPGNYRRWQKENKLALSREIVASLEQEGITHRSEKGVCLKIISLEKTFETATTWLLARGHLANFQSGGMAKEDRQKLKKLCPYYDELSLIIPSGTTTSATRSESSSQTRSVDEQLPRRQKGAHSDSDRAPIVQFTRSRDSPSSVDVQSAAEVDTKPNIETNRQRLLDMELESRKAQLEADVICNKALNRKKMLSAGIDQEEVDRLLPL